MADEYPYASSREGGTGSVTRCVPATENSRQGGTLSSFYTNNGITDGDAYNVAFTSTSGLQYCSGSCTNTGNQLIRKNLAIGPQYTPRSFVTNQGHELTSKFQPQLLALRATTHLSTNAAFALCLSVVL